MNIQTRISKYANIEITLNSSDEDCDNTSICGVCNRKFKLDKTFFIDMYSSVDMKEGYNLCNIQLHTICDKCLTKIIDTIQSRVSIIKTEKKVRKALE